MTKPLRNASLSLSLSKKLEREYQVWKSKMKHWEHWKNNSRVFIQSSYISYHGGHALSRTTSHVHYWAILSKSFFFVKSIFNLSSVVCPLETECSTLAYVALKTMDYQYLSQYFDKRFGAAIKSFDLSHKSFWDTVLFRLEKRWRCFLNNDDDSSLGSVLLWIHKSYRK